MAQNTFENPSNAEKYVWEVGHFEEETVSKRRSIEHSANTANTGLIRQQNDDQPLTFRFGGSILTEKQLKEMIRWFQLCKTQTIYFHDFAGDSYEVLITSFEPTRQYALRNSKDPTNAPNHFWRYSIEMEVVRVIDGPWEGVSP